MSEEEKKVIEHLKIERDYAYKFNNKHMITITTMALNIINKQQKEIEDLNEKIIELKEKEIIKKSLIPTQEKFEDYYNYISKDKIKEIIEDLEATINEYYNSGIGIPISDEFQYKIDILQELLEGE